MSLAEADHGQLHALIRELWPAVARRDGIDPATAHATFYPYSDPPGILYVSGGHHQGLPVAVFVRALLVLADELTARGYALERVPDGGFWGNDRVRVTARSVLHPGT